MIPLFGFLLESANPNSVGLPAATVTVVAFAAPLCASAGEAARAASAADRASSTGVLRMEELLLVEVALTLVGGALPAREDQGASSSPSRTSGSTSITCSASWSSSNP